jgi:hypothetical protein
MLLLATVTAVSACAPSVSEIGRESDSNAIVASAGSKKFQAIVPLFNYEKRDWGSYSSTFSLAKKSENQRFIEPTGVCYYYFEWNIDSNGNSRVTESDRLIRSAQVGGLDNLVHGMQNSQSGNGDANAEVAQHWLFLKTGQGIVYAGGQSDNRAAAANVRGVPEEAKHADDFTAVRVNKPEVVAATRRLIQARADIAGKPCPAATSDYFKNDAGQELFKRLSAAKQVSQSKANSQH